MDPSEFRLRRAVLADVPAISALIDRSVRSLQAGDYSAEQREAALGTVFGVDTRLIEDGTYFVVEGGAALAGCGGWSYRKTLFGGDRGAGREDALLDPERDHARIRAFFVDPAWARRGVGTMLLDACEDAAIAAGFRGFELGATLTGERLYRARGYHVVERVEAPLTGGLSLHILRMEKRTR
jgi:GNAT superfamily N-acetyltransferase